MSSVASRSTRSGWSLVRRWAQRGAPVVATQEERIEPQVLHGVHQILRHRPLGVVEVLRVALRLAAVAVAAQVGAHNRKVLGQPVRDLVPHGVGLRVAVQQQQRRPVAAPDEIHDLAASRFNLHPVKSLEQSHHSLLNMLIKSARREREPRPHNAAATPRCKYPGLADSCCSTGFPQI